MNLWWLLLALGVTLAGMTTYSTADATRMTHAANAIDASARDDPFLWLEDIHGERAMAWVKQANAVTTKQFVGNPEFVKIRGSILEVLDSDARIPDVERMGDYLYNFWRDKTHPRGIWRRTTLAEYRKAAPQWEVLLDIDALNKREDKRWVFKGVQCLKPDYQRCLLALSPDGGDAVAVREFDIPHKSFVKDGFILPVAKTQVLHRRRQGFLPQRVVPARRGQTGPRERAHRRQRRRPSAMAAGADALAMDYRRYDVPIRRTAGNKVRCLHRRHTVLHRVVQTGCAYRTGVMQLDPTPPDSCCAR